MRETNEKHETTKSCLNPLTIVTKFTRIYPARVENAAAPLRLKSDAETGDEDDDNVGVGVDVASGRIVGTGGRGEA